MTQFKWLVSNEFDLSVRSTPAPGNKRLDIFMLVEPDAGIDTQVAEKIKQPPFNFKTTGKGYWVSSSFISKDGKLDLSGLGKALKSAGIDVRVDTLTRADIVAKHDYALSRAKTFSQKTLEREFNKGTATLVGINLQGEDVFVSDNGVRAISQGASYLLSSDASNDDDKKRFLLNGELKNSTITIDSVFLTKVIDDEIRRLRPNEKWTEENTLDTLQRLLAKDPQDAGNLIEVINASHSQINQGLEKRYLSELQEDSVRSNGELKALRIASAIYSRMLPEFSDDGEKLQNYLPPIAVLAKSRFALQQANSIELDGDAQVAIDAFNALAQGESLIVSQVANSHVLDPESKAMIDVFRASGDVVVAFDLKEAQSSGVTSLYRVMKVIKSEALASNLQKEELPLNFMSTSQFSEAIGLIGLALTAAEPFPLNRSKLEEALKIKMQKELKEVEFSPTTSTGSMPTKYVVPASLAAPQKKAITELIERVGDLGEYLSAKLQMDIAKINEVFSMVQVEHISMAIARHEDGFGFVIGDGTGTGKTRQMAAIMRYQALSDEQIFFVTPDKDLLKNLWKEIKILDSENLIVPFVAATTPIVDEDGALVEFANGDTSENHHKMMKQIVSGKSVISGKFNAVFTTYTGVSQAPVIKEIDQIANYNPNFDEPVIDRSKAEGKKVKAEQPKKARVYDAVKAFKKFCARAETIFIGDESHQATGASNTNKAIADIKASCSGKIYASATAMKTARRVAPYAEAMRIPFTPSQLQETLLIGGEPALEAFAASLTEEGGYVRAEMPKNDVAIKMHVDDQNHQRYELLNDSYAEIMQTYLRMLAYVSKARAIVTDEVNFALNPDKFKPSAQSNLEIGLNTTGFSSRFTKTNELFVACLKADYIAQESIEIIRAGGKALIPLELTSEKNLEFIQETYELPKFTDKDVAAGKLAEWIAIEKAKNPQFTGVPDNFKDVLARMFIESKKVKIPHIHEGKKSDKIIDMVDLVKSYLSADEIYDFELLMQDFDHHLEQFPKLTASPYDTIMNKVNAAGFVAKAYSGRHTEIRTTEDGITYFAAGKTKGNAAIRESFQNDEIDCVIMGRSGWTGNEWHAIREKPVTLVHVVPPTSADLDQQLAGRVNRTGQTHNPTILYTSTGLLVEQRINLQAINRVRIMNATSKGDANMDSNTDDVQLFSSVGIEAVKRYLYNNTDVMVKTGFSEQDIEYNYGGGGSIATAFTSRVQMLKDSEAKVIMAGVDNEYFSLLNELAEQGIEPFGQPTMDVEAKLSKALQIDGVLNSDNPWKQPVYIASASYVERLPIQAASDVVEKIRENEEPKMYTVISASHSHQDMTINQLRATQRFDRFSKSLQIVADDAYSAIRKLTQAKIEDIEPKNGKLFTMREKFERASEMSKLLSGMKLGQVVRLSMDPSDASVQVDGVVVDIEMLSAGGYSPSLRIAVPGHGEVIATAVTVDKLSITKTPLMFSAKTTLASDFDMQDVTVNVNRVALIGSAFPTIMKASSILKSNGHNNHNAVKIVNMTIHDDVRGKYVEKVALLPKDMTLTRVISAPMELNASQCANYIRFSGEHVRTLSTAPSLSSANETDLTLKVVGTDSTGGRTIVISGLKKSFKKLCDDPVLEQFGVDATGQAGFGGSSRSKYAEIEISQANIYQALLHLEEEHGVHFYTHEFGLKFIQDFNNASLPNDYKAWAAQCRDEILSMYKDTEAGINLNEIIGNNPAMQHVGPSSQPAALTP